MKREVFDNEIAKSLFKLYPKKVKAKMNSLANSNSLNEKATIEDLFKEIATKDQVKILIKKQKQKKTDAKRLTIPKNKEIQRQRLSDCNATPKGKEAQRRRNEEWNAKPENRKRKKELNRKYYDEKKAEKMASKEKIESANKDKAAKKSITITTDTSIKPNFFNPLQIQTPLPTTQQNRNPPASTATINNPGSGFPDSLPATPPILPRPSSNLGTTPDSNIGSVVKTDEAQGNSKFTRLSTPSIRERTTSRKRTTSTDNDSSQKRNDKDLPFKKRKINR